MLLVAAILIPLAAPVVSPATVLAHATTPTTAPAFTTFVAPAGLGDTAGEPSIGVNLDTGNVFYQAYTETLRVTFDDATVPATATWASVAPPTTSIMNVDPMLITDRDTGRTYAGGLNGQCSIMAYTDDDGVTWTPVGNMCASPAFDHQTLASGPWFGGKPVTALHDRVVYYCAQTTIQQCAVSSDGGLTFGPGVALSTPISGPMPCTGLLGHVKIGPDGTAAIPSKNCSHENRRLAGFFFTQDNGQSWTYRPILPSSRPTAGFDPTLAFTPSGWIYASWQGEDNRAYASVTKDLGLTWSPAVDIGASHGVLTSVFHAAVAGDDERAAVAFLGTTNAGNAFVTGFTGTWDLYVAFTYDGGATWTTVKASDDPVQRGQICAGGVGCPTDPTTGAQPGRNLLDFIDADVDAKGHVLVAYADGCVGACAVSGTPATSQADKATIARQSGGLCLFEASDCGAAPGTPMATGPRSSCDSSVVIFSSNSAGTPPVNPNGLVCLAAIFVGRMPVDTAFINPGSDRVSVRFVQDYGGAPSLTAVVDGLGVDKKTVTLTRSLSATGTPSYNSASIRIDPTASGSITATVYAPDGQVLDWVTFRTVV